MTQQPKTPECKPSRSPGRPRSEAARLAILRAAYELLQEKALPDITSAALAERAGVSKATLYRWWPSKEAVVMDGYFEAMDAAFQAPHTDDPLADLKLLVQRGYRAMSGSDGEIFAALVASGHFHPDVRKALDDQLNSPRCKDTEHLLQRAIDAGTLREDLDLPLVVDQLFGPLMSRLMTGAPIESDLAERVLENLLNGLRA
jgi:AcrR family transcriptional regulator